jgi:TatD DNase family protein
MNSTLLLLFDTHAHLCSPEFARDLGEVLKRARAAGVWAVIAVEAGYFFSIPPSVMRSRQKQKLVKQLPLSCLLVETDSPVLGADPQVRNEPANLPMAVKVIAEIKRLSEQQVMETLAANTVRLYGALG